MDWIPKSTVEHLPDEILAAVLKLVVDSPVLRRWDWALPFPVAASRVSHRWRAITLASPELWTTIRLSFQSESWKWATLFVKRSQSYPLDISINLESYPALIGHDYGGPWPIPLRNALAIVGPHVRRWRTLALRGWEDQVQELREFLAQSPGASQLHFHQAFFYNPYYQSLGIFNTFTNAFSFPNLKYLEIISGFSGAIEEDVKITVPEEWHAPLFPHLRTLRLEHVGFGRNGLAFIQSLSRDITALHLIYTTGNQHLLKQRGDDIAWPSLRVLTVQPLRRDPNPRWLGLFLQLRPGLELTIPPWLHPRLEPRIPPWLGGVALPVESPPKLRWLSQGPSLGLMDGVDERGSKFYVDDYYLRANDFERVEIPEPEANCCCCLEVSQERELEENLERVDEEIAEAFRVGLALVRAKGFRREFRKERRRDFKVHGAGNKSS
ncbi:hypothetical protein B0H19DRAFT_1263480 [Mycena capillaripes]|nr:hypothetical protein B0H19DRAFT_1263480 [Mycena capillaripes]